MNAAVEMSLYPLNQEFKPIILSFIKKLNGHEGIRVETNSMSTQIFGDYDAVTSLITKELKQVFEEQKAVAVLKIIGRPESI